MGSSRTFSTPRERKKATAFMYFLQDSIEEFRKHFAINIPEEKKRQLEGWFLLFFFPKWKYTVYFIILKALFGSGKRNHSVNLV